MSELRNFFKDNEVKIGIDYQAGTPLYYDSLRSGFFHYFSTYLDQKDILHLILDSGDWTQDSLSHSRLEYNLSHSILSFHRFFELFLKDVLRKINPYLAVKFLEKEDELFEFLDGNLPAENIKTIEFGESLKRFRQAFKKYPTGTDVYESILHDVSFLQDAKALEALGILTEWRNRIMHNGSTFPNLFAYEYLITQRLIPLINQIVDLEKKKSGFEPHYFITPSGIKIVETLGNVDFDFKDVKNKARKDRLRYCLYYIAHLKSMGCASFTQDFYRRRNMDHKEMKYSNPIGRSEIFANAEMDCNNENECYSLNVCNCCGAKSQIVYRREIDSLSENQTELLSWCRCFNCDYSVGSNLGDPYYFGFSNISLFPED